MKMGNNIAPNHLLFKKIESIEAKIKSSKQIFLDIVLNERMLYTKDEIIPQKIIVSVETDEEKEEIIKKLKKK